MRHLRWFKILYLETGGELHHLIGLDVLQTVHTGDTVTDAQHASSFLQISLRGRAEDSFLQDGRDLRTAVSSGNMEIAGSDRHGWHSDLGDLGKDENEAYFVTNFIDVLYNCKVNFEESMEIEKLHKKRVDKLQD